MSRIGTLFLLLMSLPLKGDEVPKVNLVSVLLPQSTIVDIYRRPLRSLLIEQKAAIPLKMALRCVAQKEHLLGRKLIHSCQGTYVPRKIAGTNRWSMHAYGRAIDINMGKIQPTEVVTCFERHGWKWGGRWRYPSTDPMHFEYRGEK